MRKQFSNFGDVLDFAADQGMTPWDFRQLAIESGYGFAVRYPCAQPLRDAISAIATVEAIREQRGLDLRHELTPQIKLLAGAYELAETL